jgi:GH25 family lysozyme M1 (1,4-beta-N-acetylmuramidase)
MPNTNLAFGIDLSRYNTSPDGKIKVNFDTIAAHNPEVVFIAMRAGISWGYQDPWFAYYFQEAGRIGRVRLAYHVLYPGESPQAQMDNLFRILGDIDYAVTPLVLDLELDHGQTVSRITKCTGDSLKIIQERSGRIPIIYSRASWVNQFLRVSDLPAVHWWLAQYLWPRPYPLLTPEYPCPPAIPNGVSSWLVHQTASRGASIGAKANYFMDYNRWNGDKAAVLNYVNQQEMIPVTCPLDNLPCTGGKLKPKGHHELERYQTAPTKRQHHEMLTMTPPAHEVPCRGECRQQELSAKAIAHSTVSKSASQRKKY